MARRVKSNTDFTTYEEDHMNNKINKYQRLHIVQIKRTYTNKTLKETQLKC